VLLVHDPREDALGLPSAYGVDDLPLVIQDRQFVGGRMVLPNGMMTRMHGRRGNTLLVNGTPDAEARVPARWVRLRLVNASNARIHHLAFDDGRTFQWIASEGGLLEAPVPLGVLSLAPGERAEILVDFSDGKPVRMVTGPDANAPMMMGGMNRMQPAAGREELLLAFVPSGPAQPAALLPARLAAVPAADPRSAVRRRRLTLEMGMGGMGGMGGGAFTISGKSFDMHRVDQHVRLGDAEIWEVSGQMMEHPFHVHGVHFQVIRRGGRAPDVRDQGLRDTVMVGEPVELLVRFTQPSGNAPFMYHCHILEHEDNGMMGQYATLA
jgi:blue copper oxidase